MSLCGAPTSCEYLCDQLRERMRDQFVRTFVFVFAVHVVHGPLRRRCLDFCGSAVAAAG